MGETAKGKWRRKVCGWNIYHTLRLSALAVTYTTGFRSLIDS